MKTNIPEASPSWRRRLFSWRNARRCLLGGACLGTLGAAFFVIENWRGKKEWMEAEALARSRGAPLTMAEIAPAPVPDAENFAASPVVREWFSTDAVPWFSSDPARDFNGAARWPIPKEWGADGWSTATHADEVLAKLEPYEKDLAEIAAASRRPFARYPLHYADGPMLGLPHLAPVRYLSNLFLYRAEARLARGEAHAAADDLATVFRLAATMREEPLLLSHLHATGIFYGGDGVLRAGLAKGAWGEADLRTITEAMERLDLLRGGAKAMRGELVFVVSILRIAVDRPEVMTEVVDGLSVSNPIFRAICAAPAGLRYRNIAEAVRTQLEVMSCYDIEARRIFPKRFPQADSPMAEASPWSKILARMLCPAWKQPLITFSEAQTRLDLDRTAIDLEAWRLKQGRYPRDLAEMAGESGRDTRIHDLVTGEPFRYRPGKPGAFVLYATGLDGVDDGGDPEKDWVWGRPRASKKWRSR